MTSVRLAYVFVVIFAATLHSNGVAVSAMENFDTALIENSIPTDAGLDSGVQRRLRGTVQEDSVNEERAVSINGDLAWLKKVKDLLPTKKLSGMLEKVRLREKMEQLRLWLKSYVDPKILKTMVKNSKAKKAGNSPETGVKPPLQPKTDGEKLSGTGQLVKKPVSESGKSNTEIVPYTGEGRAV